MQTMTSSPEASPPNGARRTGATWVAATGAFLLLAAATVFVAARWSAIPDGAKLAMLVGLTGACVLAGDRLRRTLPATGNALFHVGALLVPIDGVALALRTDIPWQQLLLFDSLLAVVVLTICARRVGSVVLAAAASGAVIGTATGLAAVTPMPASFVLALFAVAACFVPRIERHAFVWATVAALAPISVLALDGIVTGQGVARELGVLAVAWPWSIATAAMVSFVVVRGARLRHEPALALIALAACAAHGIAAWNATKVPHVVDIIGPACLFLVAELVILAVRRDPFWGRPAGVVGNIIEFFAAVPAVTAIPAGIVIARAGGDWRSTNLAVAAGVSTLAWVVAAGRRSRGDQVRGLCVGAAAATAAFGLAIATGSALVVASGALVMGVVAIFAIDRTRCGPVAYAAAMYATVVIAADERLAFAGGLTAAAVIALAVFWSRANDGTRLGGLYLSMLALGLGVAGGVDATPHLLMMVAWPVVAWALAVLAERARLDGASDQMRVLAFLVLLGLGDHPTVNGVITAGVLTALCSADAFRSRRVVLAYAAILPLLVTEALLIGISHFEPGVGGIVLCAGSSVFLGAVALVRAPWRNPLAAAAGATATLGLGIAAVTAATLGPALLVVGLLVIATGLLLDQNVLSFSGAGIATLGLWMVLGTNHVLISEAYLAPVAIMLLTGGALWRRDANPRPSSWVAYGPAIAMLAASGIAERIGGGSAYHSLFAGIVGVIAVAIGGWRRSLAPLLLGTGTLVIVVIREVLDTGAPVPTWAWLAAGGAALIGAAVAMERNDMSPVEAGRRLVDVMGAQFD
jgi:hypothetical protein